MLMEQTGNSWARKKWLRGLVEVYTENWGSGLSKQSFRSYYMLPSPEDFPPFIGKAEFDSAKFIKWNDLIHPETDNENERVKISDSESDFSNDEIHRRKKSKKRKKKKKKKLFPSQLIRLIARLRRIDPELAKLEKVDFSWNKPWKKNLDSMTNIEISENSKEESAEKYQKMISKFQKD